MVSYFKYLFQMTKDIFGNLRRIYALAEFEYKLTTKGMALGQLWRILNPMIQIGVYWLVFGIGLRSGQPVDGIPYVVWLTCGLTPWLIMNRGINTAANSIYVKATMLTRSNIPTCLIPLSICLATVMDNGWTVALMIFIYLAHGCVLTWTAFGLVYYVICILFFISVLSLITSVLGMLARDFLNLIQAILRMLFFVSPIFWNPGQSASKAFQMFNLCNPFGYIICGFRDSLLYNVPIWENKTAMLIFWSMTFCLYLIGAAFQSKLRKNLLDFI